MLAFLSLSSLTQSLVVASEWTRISPFPQHEFLLLPMMHFVLNLRVIALSSPFASLSLSLSLSLGFPRH